MTGYKTPSPVCWGSWAFDALAGLPRDLRTAALIATVSLLVDEEPGEAGIARVRREVAYWLDFYQAEVAPSEPCS